MVEIEHLYEPSARLFAHYVALGGSLDPEPIRRAPSRMRARRVDQLLMGGQACLLYGAAEFRHDADLAMVEIGERRRA